MSAPTEGPHRFGAFEWLFFSPLIIGAVLVLGAVGLVFSVFGGRSK